MKVFLKVIDRWCLVFVKPNDDWTQKQKPNAEKAHLSKTTTAEF